MIRCCSVRDANFFSNRIVNIWNALPHYIVQASIITSFKRHLSRFNIAQFCFCNYLIFLCSRVFNLCDLGAHVGADALCLCVHNTQYSFFVITFRVSRRPAREMYCGHARLCVCLCVCPRPHAHTIARTRM